MRLDSIDLEPILQASDARTRLDAEVGKGARFNSIDYKQFNCPGNPFGKGTERKEHAREYGRDVTFDLRNRGAV